MRQIYYNFIREQNINDILSNIFEISYSEKLKLLQNLQKILLIVEKIFSVIKNKLK